MTTYFEQVRRCIPGPLLRVVLAVCSFQRRIGWRGAASESVRTHAAMIAGSVFSCAILHMLFSATVSCASDVNFISPSIRLPHRGKNHVVIQGVVRVGMRPAMQFASFFFANISEGSLRISQFFLYTACGGLWHAALRPQVSSAHLMLDVRVVGSALCLPMSFHFDVQ